ncbi:hypothetical protein [Mesorhizobium sp. SP-1A]|uniref:hypothetical protein n=1 Tax=Mesorhizobium sp. SP-1A TaxID=3077840 RepID=UPI0028F6E963|nr:hypothetical protein [Mesorhizobium sp. SP-1A]
MRAVARSACLGALMVAGGVALDAQPASAWSRQHDHVYADSFGNLVVESAAGYKRIIVGEGAQARKMAGYIAAESAPRVEYLYPEGGLVADCYRPPVFVKGRSYMYGLSDGEMPELSPCR